MINDKSTVERYDQKPIALLPLIDALRLPSGANLIMTLNNRTLHISNKNWTFILDAAQDKLIDQEKQ